MRPAPRRAGATRAAAARRPLWTCPACGERFVSPRLWHSCGRHTYDALFARSGPAVRALFDRVAALARGCGPVRIYPQKTRAVIQARIRFAAAYPRKSALVMTFLLPPELASPRFSKVERGLSRHYALCTVPIHAEAEIDADVRRWMRASYRIGLQMHLPA